MSEEKIYIGNGKPIGQYGDIKITVDLGGLKEHFEKYGFTTDAGKKKITYIVSERREADQYGNTHSVLLNTWKPDQQQSSQKPENFEDDIPF